MSLDEIFTKVSEDTGLSKHIVDRAYRAYWKVIREHIKALPLKDDLTDEEFLKLQPNVNIPSIGKLYVTLDRYHRMKKSREIIENYKHLKQDNNASHQED